MSWWKKEKPVVVASAVTERLAVEAGVGVDADAPWVQAQRFMDDRFLRLAVQVKNWQRVSLLFGVITLVAVCWLGWVGAQSKFVPYLVEVDKLGRTIAVRSLSGDSVLHDDRRIVYGEVIDLIENCRSVSSDVAINNSRMAVCLSRLQGAAYNRVIEELKQRRPNDVAKDRTIEVQVRVALPVTEKSWQVEWEESSFGLMGNLIEKTRWKANLEFALRPGTDEESIKINRVGFVVPQITWTKNI